MDGGQNNPIRNAVNPNGDPSPILFVPPPAESEQIASSPFAKTSDRIEACRELNAITETQRVRAEQMLERLEDDQT